MKALGDRERRLHTKSKEIRISESESERTPKLIEGRNLARLMETVNFPERLRSQPEKKWRENA
ncbi:hypothetical protein Csa_018217 [Cucumis sativus]|uniref:Uncharacterized protein n=1 Tax=Cucumis sativus TaxID=3659 RepID=A0A0A0KRD6_CUCSA|nr:hypothetical protein Csa_018217 [Cucumis sativus]